MVVSYEGGRHFVRGVNMIRIHPDKIVVYFPAGEAGKEILRRLEKYGIKGRVQEVYCG